MYRKCARLTGPGKFNCEKMAEVYKLKVKEYISRIDAEQKSKFLAMNMIVPIGKKVQNMQDVRRILRGIRSLKALKNFRENNLKGMRGPAKFINALKRGLNRKQAEFEREIRREQRRKMR
jgi:hypothetical protein